MNHQQYQSKNFNQTKNTYQVKMPAKLIHEQVLKNSVNDAFSLERKHPVAIVDLPALTINMTIGGLIPAGSSNKHRHSYETLIYILKGRGFSMIEDRRVTWEAGDAIYIPVWAWHQHFNLDSQNSAEYLACENALLLQNLGELAIREEYNA